MALAPPAAAAKLTQAQAEAKLLAAGVTWSSPGNCTNRSSSSCTSFAEINASTVDGVTRLKRASGCAVNITEGTEVGHPATTYSHWNGYMVSFTPTSCVSNYLRSHFPQIDRHKWGTGQEYYVEPGYTPGTSTYYWECTYRY